MARTPNDTNKLTRIYILRCPITNEIRYVGKTTLSLQKRLAIHIWEAKRFKNKTHKVYWIRSLLKIDLFPNIELVEEISWKFSGDREIFWISYFKSKGFNLVNHSLGGEGTLGVKASKKTRKKLSKSLTKSIGRKVYQYDLNGKFIKSFASATKASNKTGISNSKIGLVCKGSRKMAGGFQWSYVKEVKNSYHKIPHNKGRKLSEEQRLKCIRNLKGYEKKWDECKTKGYNL